MDKQILQNAGINYQSGVSRFAGHEQIYEKYLKRFIDDPEFSTLCSAMDSNDYEAAFRSAHTLKGMVGNLSIDGLYSAIDSLVEMLRNKRSIDEARAQFIKVKAEYEAVLESLESYFN